MLLNSSTSQLFSFFTSSSGNRFHLFKLQRNQSISSSPSVSSNPRLLPSSPVPTHQQIANLILEQKSADQAFQTFRWASKLRYFQHSQSTYRALIHKLCIFRRFDIVHELLDEMPRSIGFPPDEDVFVTFVRGLGRAQRFREVVKVPSLVCKFGEEPSLKIYNSILDVLVKKDIDIAREFYRKKMMDCGVIGDDYTFGILMKGLCLTNRIGDCFRLLQVMKSHGLISSTVIYNTLIHSLCKNGKVGRARSLMNVLVEPNDVTYNLLISAYCKDENYVQALVLLDKAFSSGFVPDVITVTKVIELLCNAGRISEAVEVVERTETNGRKVDVVAYNTLIKGFCRLGKAKVGIRYLKEMELKGCLPNVDTYNALISGFCEIDMLGMALDLSKDMKTAAIDWNFVTYDTLIRGLCFRGRVEEAYRILELMEQTKCASRGLIGPYNNLLYGLYRENRYVEALDFLKRMGKIFPRAVDRSLRILGLCEEGSMHDPRIVYDQMIKEGGIPSALVYSCLIHKYCRNNSVREAFELMNEMVCHGYYPVASTCNALISCFCNKGKVNSALKLLDEMFQSGCLPDIGTYSPLIDVLCKKGDLQRALMIFHQMVELGIAPNYDTWVSLFSCIRSQESTCLDSNGMPFLHRIKCDGF